MKSGKAHYELVGDNHVAKLYLTVTLSANLSLCWDQDEREATWDMCEERSCIEAVTDDIWSQIK